MIDRYHVNEYYSGAQVRVYFGHLLIDEIASIEWAGTSTKRPVYGYASTTFDAVAQGQYLCQGAFLMPFKEVGFLYAVQQSLANQGAASRRIVDAIKSQNAQVQDVQVTPVPDTGGPSPRVSVSTQFGTSPEGTNRVEQVVTTLTPDDVLEEEATRGGRSFHDLVEGLQNTIWDVPGETREPIVRPDEFDLDNTDPKAPFVHHGFNILVTFGDVNNPKQSSTVKSLIDVHLTGDQRVIATDGNPIFERYTFFCRATDETLGQYRIIPDRISTPATDPATAPEPSTTPPRKGAVPLPWGQVEPEPGPLMLDEPETLRRDAFRKMGRPLPARPLRSSATEENVAETFAGPLLPQGVDPQTGSPMLGEFVPAAPRYKSNRANLPRPLVGRIAAPSQAAEIVATLSSQESLPRRMMNALPFKTGETVIITIVESDDRGLTWYWARNDQSINARIWEGWFVPD